MKKICAFLLFIICTTLVLTACVQSTDPASPFKVVPCPIPSKLTGKCIVKQDAPDVLTDGHVDYFGLSNIDFTYAEISSPKGTFLYVSGVNNSPGNGTNFVTVSLPAGVNVAEIQIKLECDPNSNGENVIMKYYKQFK